MSFTVIGTAKLDGTCFVVVGAVTCTTGVGVGVAVGVKVGVAVGVSVGVSVGAGPATRVSGAGAQKKAADTGKARQTPNSSLPIKRAFVRTREDIKQNNLSADIQTLSLAANEDWEP